ncbi:hypothetical protein [Streptomyces sp. NPDC059378]|uniref:hypothetical protein n=1 Tax=Streptomyces sp. NPDC059378 TaxID=3346815 RepID=UPI0036893426
MIDTTTNTVAGSPIPVGTDPAGIAITPRRGKPHKPEKPKKPATTDDSEEGPARGLRYSSEGSRPVEWCSRVEVRNARVSAGGVHLPTVHAP